MKKNILNFKKKTVKNLFLIDQTMTAIVKNKSRDLATERASPIVGTFNSRSLIASRRRRAAGKEKEPMCWLTLVPVSSVGYDSAVYGYAVDPVP